MATFTKAPPRRSIAGWRLLLGMGALAVLVVHGMASMSVLMNQAALGDTRPITLPSSTIPLTPDRYAALITDQLSLRDKIAQMIMIKLQGTTLTTGEAQMVQQQHVGAVLAFGDAIETVGQVKRLTGGLQSRAAIPLFVATDQEGKQVNRFAAIYGPQSAADSLKTAENAKQFGVQTATYFANLGFNMNLAPVVDINEPRVTTGQLYQRTFSSDPQVVATLADAYLQGFQGTGQFVGVVKHFPGLGSSQTDPHRGLPIITKNQAQLTAHEFVPYRLMLQMGHVQAIMVTHELMPAIDDRYPSTLSYKLVTGMLREGLGFHGVVVTDDLNMEALAAQYSIDQAALLATAAGNDILMGPKSPDEVSTVIETIVTSIERGDITESRINDSVRRILSEKIQLGLIALPTPSPSPIPSATVPLNTPTATPKPKH